MAYLPSRQLITTTETVQTEFVEDNLSFNQSAKREGYSVPHTVLFPTMPSWSKKTTLGKSLIIYKFFSNTDKYLNANTSHPPYRQAWNLGKPFQYFIHSRSHSFPIPNLHFYLPKHMRILSLILQSPFSRLLRNEKKEEKTHTRGK